ncbi:hypothetical protein [Bacillus sp. NEAU-Y102]
MGLRRIGIVSFSLMVAVNVAGIILSVKDDAWWDVVGYAAAGFITSGIALVLYKHMVLIKISFVLLMLGIILGALLIAKYLVYGEYGYIFWMSVIMLMGAVYILYAEKEDGLKWE